MNKSQGKFQRERMRVRRIYKLRRRGKKNKPKVNYWSFAVIFSVIIIVGLNPTVDADP
jgi:hypothetical protein